jgi:aspartate kinase
MKVCKFGGSSLADAGQVRKVCDLVLADPARRVVVVSAPGRRRSGDEKVTDLLIACARHALAGADTEAPLAAVVARYDAICRDLGLPAEIAGEIEADLRRRLASDRSHAGRFLDLLKAAGEAHAARLVAAALRARGADARCLDPCRAGMLLQGECGNATLREESYGLLAASLAEFLGRPPAAGRPGPLAVFPGFFGVTRDGRVATFSRGGSDITGAILAAAVKAECYENFTDVDNVYAVDPRIVPEVRHAIREMTFREMRELAYAGFGVFHDEAVLPAIRAGIPIVIRNTNHPGAPGTRIVPRRETAACAVVGIASDTGFVAIYVDKYMMNREIGFGRRLLQILEDEGVSFEHMPSGIDNVSVVLRESRFDAACEARVVERIRRELRPDAVLVERDHALIMVVGEGMQYAVGMAARATRALAEAGVNIEMINQGASEISMMFGVRSADRDRAVRALYHAFFPDEPRPAAAAGEAAEA